jgi:hypothetical protein
MSRPGTTYTAQESGESQKAERILCLAVPSVYIYMFIISDLYVFYKRLLVRRKKTHRKI